MNLRILDLVGKRLIKGERKYGHENVENDGRDFTEEALEEALDCAVYLAARIVEIQNKKEKQMGRAIKTENVLAEHGIEISELKARLKFLEDAFAEQAPNTTRVHHVDLTDVENLRAEGIEVTPDEEFTPPAGRRKTKKGKKETARKVESML